MYFWFCIRPTFSSFLPSTAFILPAQWFFFHFSCEFFFTENMISSEPHSYQFLLFHLLSLLMGNFSVLFPVTSLSSFISYGSCPHTRNLYITTEAELNLRWLLVPPLGFSLTIPVKAHGLFGIIMPLAVFKSDLTIWWLKILKSLDFNRSISVNDFKS